MRYTAHGRKERGSDGVRYTAQGRKKGILHGEERE